MISAIVSWAGSFKAFVRFSIGKLESLEVNVLRESHYINVPI